VRPWATPENQRVYRGRGDSRQRIRGPRKSIESLENNIYIVSRTTGGLVGPPKALRAAAALFGAAGGCSQRRLWRWQRESCALGRETHVDVRAVAKRLVLGLSAAAERDGRAADEVVSVAGLVYQRDVLPFHSQGAVFAGCDSEIGHRSPSDRAMGAILTNRSRANGVAVFSTARWSEICPLLRIESGVGRKIVFAIDSGYLNRASRRTELGPIRQERSAASFLLSVRVQGSGARGPGTEAFSRVDADEIEGRTT